MDQVSHPASADEVSISEDRPTSRRLPSRFFYALTILLMLVIILQVLCISTLKFQFRAVSAELNRADESLSLVKLRLNSFVAKDPDYQGAKIAVAWDAFQHQGVITAQNLPVAPSGYNYQLWVLDPGALAPFNAGVIHNEKSTNFKVQALSTVDPGFAISLEPAGNSSQPTGSILFAVEPGQ